MGFNDALVFAGAAPFIAAVVAFVKSFVTIPARLLPPLALVLSVAWGVVLVLSDRFDGDPAQFVAIALTVSFAASGIQSNLRAYNDSALKYEFGARGGDSGD